MVSGYPHTQTFDGGYPKFFGDGEWWLVRSAMVLVQGRFQGTRSTHGFIATRKVVVGGRFLQGHMIVVGAHEEGDITFDGHPVLTSFPSSFELPGGLGRLAYHGGGRLVDGASQVWEKNVVRMDLPLGVLMEVFRWDNYVDVRIVMPPQPDQDGTCGNYNSDADDDGLEEVVKRMGGRVGRGLNMFGDRHPNWKPFNEELLKRCPDMRVEIADSACAGLGPHDSVDFKVCKLDMCFGSTVHIWKAAPATRAAPAPPAIPQAHECMVSGYPHTQTFDGGYPKFFGDGEWWLVRSAMVLVQGRFQGTRSTHGFIATRKVVVGGRFLQGHMIVVGAHEEGDITFDGHPVLTSFPSSFELPGGLGRLAYHGGGRIVDGVSKVWEKHVVRMDLPLGVSVEVFRWNSYINVRIVMPPQPGQDGTCGNYNSDASDDGLEEVVKRMGGRVRQGEDMLATACTRAGTLVMRCCSRCARAPGSPPQTRLAPVLGFATPGSSSCASSTCASAPACTSGSPSRSASSRPPSSDLAGEIAGPACHGWKPHRVPATAAFERAAERRQPR